MCQFCATANVVFVSGGRRETRKHSPKINHQPLKRSTVNTPTTSTCRSDSTTVVRYEFSLATYARVAAIEEWACLWAVGIAPPMPVWLRAIESAFCSQRRLIGKSVVAMPREKVTSSVDPKRVLHVDDDKIVES